LTIKASHITVKTDNQISNNNDKKAAMMAYDEGNVMSQSLKN
jgi:hypothetical protein